MENYLDKITPQLGDTWRADELFLKGDMKYLFALVDDETRFWIAGQVAETKYHADIHELFHTRRKIASKPPEKIITDGAMNFGAAINDEFWREKKQLALVHDLDIRFGGEIHNNKMERMNGEIRDREKVMRSLKRPDTPILTGYRIFHNYVRPHMALEAKTPADLAGISVKGENKWITLIQNASQKQKGYAKQV
jgi:transposase-like protein